jgi:hypothetical protein
MDAPSPPALPADRLAGWRQVADTTERPFEAGPVAVTARTLVYEDARLGETVRDRTGVDGPWRFFFASRLAIRPATSPSAALRRLVVEGARRGFVERLRDRGFEAPSEAERRTIRVGDADASLTGYDAACRFGPLRLSVAGWLAVWSTDGRYLVAGGAYPTAVVDDEADGDLAASLSDVVEPDRFRQELFSLLRATG